MSNNNINVSVVKRERTKKEETTKAINKMRKALPVYTLEEIRQHKLPYHEAMLINLEEQGFTCTCAFIKQLIEYQTAEREQAEPGSNAWMRPQLMACRKELTYLSDKLRISEQYHKNEKYSQQCESFLQLAIYFAFLSQDWWWLGEQLLIQSIQVSSEYTVLGGKYEAFSRFAYAKFLIDNIKEHESALDQLETARTLSSQKAWSLKAFFPDATRTLFMEINFYMYLCYIKEAKCLMYDNYKKAAELAKQARKRAAEACFHEGETDAFLLKGLCDLNNNDPKSAIVSLSSALRLQEKLNSNEGKCMIMIQLSKAYMLNGDMQKALKILLSLKDIAEKNNLLFYLAQSYKNLGEYHLNSGEPDKANPLLTKAMGVFENIRSSGTLFSKEVSQVRILEAIATGLELFPKYMEILYQTGQNTREGVCNLMKLVDWKDSRKAFWDTEDKTGQQRTENRYSFIESEFTNVKELGDAELDFDDKSKEREIINEQTEIPESLDEIVEKNHLEEETVAESHSLEELEIKMSARELIELHDNKEIFTEDSVVKVNDVDIK